MKDGNAPVARAKTAIELKQEIDALFELQRQALESATFLGMTQDQAREVEARRKQISALVDQLAQPKASR